MTEEYIRRQAALDEANTFFTMSMCMTTSECDGMNRAARLIAQRIKDIPTADVVEVVRCKDCIRSELDGWRCGSVYVGTKRTKLCMACRKESMRQNIKKAREARIRGMR